MMLWDSDCFLSLVSPGAVCRPPLFWLYLLWAGLCVAGWSLPAAERRSSSKQWGPSGLQAIRGSPNHLVWHAAKAAAAGTQNAVHPYGRLMFKLIVLYGLRMML